MSCSRYEISKILSENLTTDIDISDLFFEAEKLKLDCPNSTHYLNYVGLVGAAKIGKTKLVKEIIDYHSNNFFFVFYFDLGKIDYENPINLLNLLVPENRIWMLDDKKTNAVLQTMVDNPEKNLFIMDELDTAKFGNVSDKFPQSNYFQKRYSRLFILNILRGDIFDKSKKIIVSRPLQHYNLPDDCKPKFVANVIGLTKDMQKNICEVEDLDLPSTFAQLRSKQEIHSLCAVPLNCETLINYLKEKEGCCITLTNIIAEVFCQFVEVLNHCPNQSVDLDRLSEFAHSQLIKNNSNKFFFDLRELKNKLDEACIDCFFSTELCQKYLHGASKYYFLKFRFSNLLVREFFVTLRLFRCDSLQLEKFLSLVSENLLENTDNSLNYVVILFLFGLCDDESKELSEQLFNTDNLNLSNIKSSLKGFLTKFALQLKAGNSRNEKVIKLKNEYQREMKKI